MRKLLATTAIAASVLLTISGAAAQDKESGKKPSAQQERMKSCNAQAADKKLKGDDRKSFMSECLKNEQNKRTAQQEKMKSCNKKAGDSKMKGDDRKKFMSECLKG